MELLLGAMNVCDMTDRHDHGVARVVAGVHTQISLRQLKLLTVREAVSAIEDLLENLAVTPRHQEPR
jgi:hypothetical protein